MARYPASRFDGCFVVAMGTNDPANQYVGGTWPLGQRIDLIMHLAGDRPVLWLSAKTLVSRGPYANKEMAKWNDALRRACSAYPRMRVYDWAAEVRQSWYLPDGIHFTPKGYAERGRRTARALAEAFPRDGESPPGCFLRSP